MARVLGSQAPVARFAGHFSAFFVLGLNQRLEVIKDQGRASMLRPPQEQQFAKVVAGNPIQ